MSITVARLHKALTVLIEQGHGRKPVCIDESTFHHPLEGDGAVVLEVESVAGPAWISMSDDDGWAKLNGDGTESGRHVVILKGGA